jgi:hypothetical protein
VVRRLLDDDVERLFKLGRSERFPDGWRNGEPLRGTQLGELPLDVLGGELLFVEPGLECGAGIGRGQEQELTERLGATQLRQ